MKKFFYLCMLFVLLGCDIGLKIKDIKQLNALLDGGIKIQVNIDTDAIPDGGLIVHVEGIPEDIPIRLVYGLPTAEEDASTNEE